MAGYKGGFGGGGFNMQQMMKQAQKMQEQMQQAQQELEESEVEATAGGGMITVTMTGTKKITGIRLDPEIVDPDDTEMLEDMLLAACNEAFDKAEELYKSKMGRFGGMM